MARRRTSRVVWLRRAVQTAFLLLFVMGSAGVVKLFFQFDPLAMASTLLASHAVGAGMWLSVATLAVTFLFGRWFCGWICPLGTLHQMVGRASWPAFRHEDRQARRPAPLKPKYYILALLLAAALLGVNVSGWLDPFSFLFRSLAIAINPALNDAVARATSTSGLFARQPHYFSNVLIGFLFISALALNFYRERFWCHSICPLGALLGVVARNPLVRLNLDADACGDCGLCGACPDRPGSLPHEECFYCFNCMSDCPTGAITFGFGKASKPVSLDLGRRAVLASGAAGLGAALLFHTHPLGETRSFNADLVRPPGSLAEDEFLSRCIRCGECMKVCPTNGLHPAAFEAGPEGPWTPVMKMALGYCEYECVLCSQVCPSGAIRPLEIAEKQKLKIGLAYIDRNRCLPYAYGRACIVCEEHCPTPKKAIWFEEVNGLKQPRVDAALCIGCGICTNKCVIKAPAAIQVMSAGETRNPENGVLL